MRGQYASNEVLVLNTTPTPQGEGVSNIRTETNL